MATMDGAKTFTLEAEHELRLEVEHKKTLTVTLLKGTAELFGAELPRDQPLPFTGTKLAIFTWHGATLEALTITGVGGGGDELHQVKGEYQVAYVADETPMRTFVNTHAVLEARRVACREATASGQTGVAPVTMVVGPTDSGKSSLCKLLVNYAVRQGWKPLLVDLDLGQGMFTLPGTLAATVVERPLDPVEGVSLDAPLIYYYGAASPGDNPEHFQHLVDRLAQVLAQRKEDEGSGVIVNTMGWVDGEGYRLLVHSAKALRVNVVLVLGQDRLHSELDRDLAGSGVDVVKLAKSGGVVTRQREFRKEYFYGVKDDLRVTTRTAAFHELAVFRVGGALRAPASALPLGADPVANPLRVQSVTWSKEMVHSVLAVSHATDADDILSANIAGFVWVTDVDTVKGRVTYHAPSAGPLPSHNLILGDLKFYE